MDVTTTYTRHAAQRRSPMLTRAGEEHLTAVHRPVTSKAKSPGECSNRLETRASLHTSARERSSSTTPGEFLPKFKAELERTVEVKGWGGHVRTTVFVPDDGGAPDLKKWNNNKEDTFRRNHPAMGYGAPTQTPNTAKSNFFTTRYPTAKDQLDLSENLVTDWVVQTIPEPQRDWSSTHLINSTNACEWDLEDVLKSQKVKQDFNLKMPQYSKNPYKNGSPSLMRYTNLFPFRGAGRLDGKPHLSLNPAGLVPNDMVDEKDRGVHKIKVRNTSIPALCLSTTQSKSNVHIRPYNPPASSHGARGGVLIVKVPGGPTRAPKYDIQKVQQNLAKESEIVVSQTKPRSRSVNDVHRAKTEGRNLTRACATRH